MNWVPVAGTVVVGVAVALTKDAIVSGTKASLRWLRSKAKLAPRPEPAPEPVAAKRLREEAAIARMNVERSNRLLKALIKGLEETGAFIPETVIDLKDQRRGFRSRVSELAPVDSEQLITRVEEWYNELVKALEEATQLESGIRLAWTQLPRDQRAELPGKSYLPQFRSLLERGEGLFRDALRTWR